VYLAVRVNSDLYYLEPANIKHTCSCRLSKSGSHDATPSLATRPVFGDIQYDVVVCNRALFLAEAIHNDDAGSVTTEMT